ncbi:MAG: hypothetical protein WBJ21_04505 [Burkholderiaceae bacterium]|jgi:ElaB/YqjD/DUF883 family membrane-anchored ribosome-binding protein
MHADSKKKSPEQTQFFADVREIFNDTKAMLGETAQHGGEKVSELRQQIENKLSAAHEDLLKLEKMMLKKKASKFKSREHQKQLWIAIGAIGLMGAAAYTLKKRR